MAESNKHIDDSNANQSSFLSVQEAVAAGWMLTRYCVNDVACAACETLIACVSRDGSTRCHGCDWAPGSYPSTADELREFAGLVRRRYTRGFSVADVRQLRLFLLGQSDDKPHVIKLSLPPRMIEHLERFAQFGLYGGPTIAAVAEELLRARIREELFRWRQSR